MNTSRAPDSDAECKVASRLQVNESKALLSAALDGFGIVLGAEDFLEPVLRNDELDAGTRRRYLYRRHRLWR